MSMVLMRDPLQIDYEGFQNYLHEQTNITSKTIYAILWLLDDEELKTNQ
jgi:hypothetical protein